MKRIVSVLLALFLAACCFGEKFTSKEKNYNVTAYYPAAVQPGDAVFVKFIFEARNTRTKKKIGSTTGTLTVSSPEIKDKTCSFYLFNNEPGSKIKSSKNEVILCGIPLSTYTKEGEYTLSAFCKPFGLEEKTYTFTFKVESKEFISETIKLDARNTGIRTNTSKERQQQIDTLNAIFGTITPEGTWQSSPYRTPSTATRITSTFGDRRVFEYNNGKSSTTLHYGKDYGVPTGTEVRSCARGKVMMAENRISTGWSVVIEHLPGLYSIYYHMSELKVEAGQIVNPGDLIGLSGATGLATGPHLHWEMRLNWEAVNPDFFTTDFAFFNEK